MSTLDNTIEIQYKKLEQYRTLEYIDLYQIFPHCKLREVLSTVHELMTRNYEAMNSRLPTNDCGQHFWAEHSRELLLAIRVVQSLQRALENTAYAFIVDEYYQKIILKSKEFLCDSGGSEIPPYMEEVELYYKIPIFLKRGDRNIEISTPKIKKIDHEYIRGMLSRAMEDIDHSHYDSALTKARTMLEEVFIYAIEAKKEKPVHSGEIAKLYKQVRELYNMHSDNETDQRIKKLLSGLGTIVVAITEMRNKEGDAHGVGSGRRRIAEHHTRLFVNASMMMADFILSVVENSKTCHI